MSTVSWLEGAGLPAARGQLQARAPQLAVWALAAAIGVQAALILTRLAGADVSRPQRPVASAGAVSRPRLDAVALGNGHLFGQAPPPAPVDDANAPPSSMPLVLTGTIAAADPRNGLAIIGTTATNAKIYPVGMRVPGNATVHAVYTDRVLLERNGTIEALMLPHKFTGRGTEPQPGPVVSALDRVQRAISNEPSLISDVLRPQPVFAEGKLHGYRVYPGRNARAFASLGLRNGDLVLAINGTPLDDPARGNDIFSSLGNTDQARVTVMRNGQQQDISLNMSQIATQAEQLSSGNADPAASGAATADKSASSPDQAPTGPAAPPGAVRDNR